MFEEDIRPPIDAVASAAEFERWYWSVNQLKAKCEKLGLPKTGSKSEMRPLVASSLSTPGKQLPKPAKPKRNEKSFLPLASTTTTTTTFRVASS